MSEIQPYTFPTTGQSVRTLLADGEPWFIATDVCAALGHSNSTVALAMVDEDDRWTLRRSDALNFAYPIDDLRIQSVNLVNESGLYSLILRSNVPGARAFKRWVTREVLPSIRKTGSFRTPAQQFPDMTTPEGRRAMARAFLEATEREVELADRVAELEPKALAHDVFTVAADSDRLVSKVAKDLGWREKDLRGFLLDEKLIFRRQRVCGGFEYDFYAAFRPHFTSKETQVTHAWGPCNHYTLYVTPRGMELIHARIARRKAEQQATIAAS